MDLSSDAPNGPGWYIRKWFGVTTPELQSEVTAEQAERICAAIDFTLDTDQEYTNIAKSGNKLVYNALEKQLKEAEEQATRISSLRKRLSEFNVDNNDQEQ